MTVSTTSGEEETRALGRAFARRLRPGDCVALVGPLGSGKTRFVQGVCEGLGAPAAASSPTFTLVHEYRGGRTPVFHFDLYRIRSQREVIDLAFEEYLDAGGVCLIEWAERARDLLPARRYEIAFRHASAENLREIEVTEPEGVAA
jgi:tRNA threonylcarbamoyladenosine biosynthesis protein TsaE